jgi:hypothetical protein
MTSWRQSLLVRWINNLKISTPLTVHLLPEQFRTGVLLAKLIKRLDPGVENFNILLKPSNRSQCLANLQNSFSVLSCKGLELTENLIENIYSCKPGAAWNLVNLIFVECMMRDVLEIIPNILAWAHDILSKFCREIDAERSYEEILDEFRDGTHLACLLNNYFNAPESRDIYWSPENKIEVRHNLNHFINNLKSHQLLCCFDIDEFLSKDSDEFIFLQIFYLYLELSERKGSNQDKSQLVFKDDKRLRARAMTIVEVDKVFNESNYNSASCRSSTGNEDLEFSFAMQDDRCITPDPNISSDLIEISEKLKPSRLSRESDYEEYESLARSSSKILKNIVSVPKDYIHTSPNYKRKSSMVSPRDSIICFLLTPRIIRISSPNSSEVFPFLFNLVPNEINYSIHKQEFFIEWKDIKTLQVIGAFSNKEISGVKLQGSKEIILSCRIREKKFNYRLILLDETEAQQYLSGLQVLSCM